jgi:hypothetical protein
VNQCVETYLRCFINAYPNKWLLWLPLAEFWYNTSWHSAINRPPFEALYGYSPHQFGLPAAEFCSSDDLNKWLQERLVMTYLVKQHLNRVLVWMKHQADKGRSEREFGVS